MSTSTRLIVATVARSTELLVERATRTLGLALSCVAATPEAICGALENDGDAVVVLDGLQQESAALDCARVVISRRPGTRVVVLGSRPDLAIIAKLVRAGAWNYVLPYTAADEFITVISGAVSGVPAESTTLFGRVRACLPSHLEGDGRFLMPDGQVISLHDAFERSKTLGLSTVEVAECLGVTPQALAWLETAKRSNATGTRSGLFSGVADVLAKVLQVISVGQRSTGTASERGGRTWMRPEIGVVGLVAVTLLGLSWLWSPRMVATYAVNGTVAFLGQPVESGQIVFEPEPGAGQMRSAMIRSGSFTIPKKEGLPRDRTYIVRVYAYRATGEKYENADMSLSAEIQEQILPPRYNEQSDLRFETKPANLRSGLTLDLK